MKKHLLLTGILGLCLLAACQTVPEPRPDSAAPPAVAQPEPAQWLKALKDRESAFRDLRSFVKTTIETSKGKQTLRQVLLVRGDGAFRMDTLSLFGQPLGVLIVSPQKTLLYDPRKNETHTGDAVWRLMYDMLGTRFDFQEYIPLFSGNLPGIQGWQASDVRALPRGAGWEIRPAGSALRLWLELDAATGLPVRLQKWVGGEPLYQVEWQDYRDAAGFQFPHVITVHRPRAGDSVTLKYSEPRINQGLPEQSFDLQLS